jgi:hypothetical protein
MHVDVQDVLQQQRVVKKIKYLPQIMEIQQHCSRRCICDTSTRHMLSPPGVV